MPQPQQIPEQCIERKEIVEAIRGVMIRIIQLHNAETEALKKHDLRELERITIELEKASGCESLLLEKFQAHLQSHGCQPPKALSDWDGLHSRRRWLGGE